MFKWSVSRYYLKSTFPPIAQWVTQVVVASRTWGSAPWQKHDFPTRSALSLLAPGPVEGTGFDNHICVLSRFSRVWLFATPWTVACQAPLSLVFSKQEYWSGLPCPPPGDLSVPGIEPSSLSLLHWQVRESFPRQVDRKSRGPQGERGLQMEEIACKSQTFLSLLSGRRKQTSNIFFLLYTNLKRGFS